MYRIGEKIASEWAEARLPHHIRKLSEFMDEKDDDDDRSHRTHHNFKVFARRNVLAKGFKICHILYSI